MSRPTTLEDLDALADLAVEILLSMPRTCSLRSPADTNSELGAHLGMCKDGARKSLHGARRSYEMEGGASEGLTHAARATPMQRGRACAAPDADVCVAARVADDSPQARVIVHADEPIASSDIAELEPDPPLRTEGSGESPGAWDTHVLQSAIEVETSARRRGPR